MRHVLITGAGNGIGRATAEAFVRAGDRVVAAMRDPERSGAVEGAESVALDVCDDSSVTSALAGREPFDVVVNNAGISRSGPVETIDIEAARRMFETNYRGAVRVVRAVLAPMRKRRAAPYAQDEAWVRRFFLEGSKSHAIAASTVADEIVAIAAQSHPKLHHPVGPDAVAGVAAAQSPAFEAWYTGALGRVVSLAGPRPL